jgi:uncharacterized protein (DUF58 family)
VQDSRIYTNLSALLALKEASSYIHLSPRYRPAGMLSGQHASRLRGSGLNFEELRQYQNGDNIRQIDSRTSARLGKPYVRVYSEETDRPVQIVVDQRLPMFFGSVEKTKSVIAAELAALLAWIVLGSGDRVGGIVVGSRDIRQIPARRSSNNVVQLLEAIVTANNQLSLSHQKANVSSLFSQIKPWLSHLTSQSVVILITDIEGLGDTDIAELETLHHRANILLFLVQDPLEADLSHAHGLSVSQGQEQINIQATAQNQQNYDALYQKKLKQLKTAMAASPLPLGIVNTIEPVTTQLMRLFEGQKR